MIKNRGILGSVELLEGKRFAHLTASQCKIRSAKRVTDFQQLVVKL